MDRWARSCQIRIRRPRSQLHGHHLRLDRGGFQPDVVNPPLVRYHTNGNAGETPAGISGGVQMYDYQFALPLGLPGCRRYQVLGADRGLPARAFA